jgi:hypothetical protein
VKKGKAPTSWSPLLAHSKHTIGGPPGTEVSTLRPPISHTFSRSQSSWGKKEYRTGEPVTGFILEALGYSDTMSLRQAWQPSPLHAIP